MFETDSHPVGTLPDGWLATLTWRDDPDLQRLRDAALAGDADRVARQLIRRGVPDRHELPPGVVSTCRLLADLLTADAFDASEHLTRETLLAVHARASRRELKNHVAALLDAANEEARLSPAVLSAWLGLLCELPQLLDSDLYFRLWHRGCAETTRFAASSAVSESDPLDVGAELRDEVLLRASIVFSPLSQSEEWRKVAIENWRGRLAQAGRETPWPPIQGAAWRGWVQSLARVSTDAATYGLRIWKKKYRTLLKAFSGQLAGLLLSEGQMLGQGPQELSWGHCVANLLMLSDWSLNSPPVGQARKLLKPRFRSPLREDDSAAKPRRPSFQSDVGTVALLRRDWGLESDAVFINYAGRAPRLQVLIDGQMVLDGPWETRVAVNDAARPIDGDWKCDCWVSDRDADYVELTAPLGGELKLMRQLLLDRREKMVLIAEAVRGVGLDSSVRVHSTLPIASDVDGESDGLTRELQLRLPRRRLRLFPLLLPWERASGGAGSCRVTDGELRLEASQSGPVCQAVLLAWGSKRGDEPAEAALLRVGEDARHLPASDAVAARVRVGARQWLYWHNFTQGRVPRTCLGHHSAYETIIARVKTNGDADILLHVEGATT